MDLKQTLTTLTELFNYFKEVDEENRRLKFLAELRVCSCGQAWKPAAGLFNTTEEIECPACVLRKLLEEERKALLKEREANINIEKERELWRSAAYRLQTNIGVKIGEPIWTPTMMEQAIERVISKVRAMEYRQTQYSLSQQLAEMKSYAVEKGLYDAADWVEERIRKDINKEVKHG